MLCVIDVYLRDITNVIFVILHLNVSHQSICSSRLFSNCVSCDKSISEVSISLMLGEGDTLMTCDCMLTGVREGTEVH